VVADPFVVVTDIFPLGVLADPPVDVEFVTVLFIVAVEVPPDGGTGSVILFLSIYSILLR
jgi:hypothetical protein